MFYLEIDLPSKNVSLEKGNFFPFQIKIFNRLKNRHNKTQGERYIGESLNGMKHGFGTFFFKCY